MRGVEQIPWLYDAYMALVDRGGFARWRRWLASGARGDVLEVGCGTGRNLPHYDRPRRVTALELDPGMLSRARRRAPEVRFVVGSAEDLPFRDVAFDTVVSALVFCSVTRPGRGLGEIRRVLRAAGTLRMMEHVRSDLRPVARLQDLLQPAWTLISGGCHPNRDTEEAVRRAGFAIEPEGRRAKRAMRRFGARPIDERGVPGASER
jgi:ubiquinone/menaquinone biosynthesis C-methylase UbiE